MAKEAASMNGAGTKLSYGALNKVMPNGCLRIPRFPAWNLTTACSWMPPGARRRHELWVRDLGIYDTCHSGCAYCCANKSPGEVRSRVPRHDPAEGHATPRPGLCLQDMGKLLVGRTTWGGGASRDPILHTPNRHSSNSGYDQAVYPIGQARCLCWRGFYLKAF